MTKSICCLCPAVPPPAAPFPMPRPASRRRVAGKSASSLGLVLIPNILLPLQAGCFFLLRTARDMSFVTVLCFTSLLVFAGSNARVQIVSSPAKRSRKHQQQATGKSFNKRTLTLTLAFVMTSGGNTLDSAPCTTSQRPRWKISNRENGISTANSLQFFSHFVSSRAVKPSSVFGASKLHVEVCHPLFVLPSWPLLSWPPSRDEISMG